jgi:hypothetical protein
MAVGLPLLLVDIAVIAKLSGLLRRRYRRGGGRAGSRLPASWSTIRR